jgi:glycerol-3-phosphate O-acyltransferase
MSHIKAGIRRIRTWAQFRRAMASIVDFIIDRTTDGISYSGLENLGKKRGTIYISTHRSTSLDPILFNHMLYRHCGETAYNAAGDNLLHTPWLGHLIRLNRGFIVRREVGDMEQKLFEAERLSAYIRKLTDRGRSVWIAQRNGRAKDGMDRTDSAVLAMLKLAHREKSWEEFSSEVDIVPVSISYEEIPLDTLLVKDHLGLVDTSDKGRDSGQVMDEIAQKKRRIHIHVSQPVRAAKRGELVKAIDRNIIRGVRLWDSNLSAAGILGHIGDRIAGSASWIAEKVALLRPEIAEKLLELYAAPVLSRKQIDASS